MDWPPGRQKHTIILPDGGWVSRYLERPEDVETAVALLRQSYDLARHRGHAPDED